MRFSGRRMECWGVQLALVWVFTARLALAQDVAVPSFEGEEGRPPLVRVFLGTAVPWRQYCARPGVTSCGEFDARDPSLRQGDTVDFHSQVPYAGGAVEVEFFPLARQASLLRGLGLTAGYQHGFARTLVKVRSPTGGTPEREVFATDQSFEAMVAWRYFFGLGKGAQPLWAQGGLRLGLLGRAFAGSEAVESPLPVTHRLFPAVGLDVSVKLLRELCVVGAGQLFLLPRPGAGEFLFGGSTLVAEVRDYGESVSSFGWSAELGLAGELWGPVGYSARFRLSSFLDSFSGEGTRRGWLTGGVAEELYATALAGVTLSW